MTSCDQEIFNVVVIELAAGDELKEPKGGAVQSSVAYPRRGRAERRDLAIERRLAVGAGGAAGRLQARHAAP